MTVGEKLDELLERDRAEQTCLEKIRDILNELRIDIDDGNLSDVGHYLDELFKTAGIDP